MDDVRVGEFFLVDEMTATSVPSPNNPGPQALINLTRLCCLVLDPLRRLAGPLKVTSGYRSAAVNEAVAGSKNSYHLRGLAADIQSENHSPRELLMMLGGLEYDKAINEFDRWLHVQIAPLEGIPRGQMLVAKKRDDGTTEYKLA